MTATLAPAPPIEKTTTTASSVARLIGIDAARGVALIGMMAVHVLPDSTGDGDPTWSFTLFAGRASALFAVLAGVSVALLTGRRRVRLADAASNAAGLAARALVVGAIGFALGYTDPQLATVILPFYALLFVAAIPLVLLPTWAVGVVGLIVLTGAPVATHLLLGRLPESTGDNYSFVDLWSQPWQLFTELGVTGEFPALAWLAYLCAGLVVGRLTLSRMRTVVGLIVIGAVMAYAAHAVSMYLLHARHGVDHIMAARPAGSLTLDETQQVLDFGADGTVPGNTWWWLALDKSHTGTSLDLLVTIGSAFVVLGVLLAAARLAILARLLRPLAAAGRMTLTLYTLHLAFINSEFDHYSRTTSFIAQTIAALLIGLAWTSTAGRGPLESLVTAITRRARRAVSRTKGGS
ncbi:heparan-alpha-glucosaminide N-acetyltransferase domain-containing protein [Nocardia sp. NPDC051570]|uniref:heparan-alpha-glucosaminide N-acetyltransferase domain-containing protein n=1 Tax=Nocardia sp. NPDC051570 TaxID=3364324 RepID=UPI00379ED274